MKKKNVLPLFFLAPALLLNGLAYSSELKEGSSNASQRSNNADKAWNFVADQVKSAKLKTSVNLVNYNNDGLSANLVNQTKSEPSLGDKYSGIDVWQFNLNYVPSTFANSGIVPGLGMTTEVTFIQQFDSRMDSVLRFSYNPIFKLPINADRALKLKEGDFVAFRAPMTFSLGKSLSEQFAKKMAGNLSLSLFTTGEFDIHVFRMPNNLVRIKLVALREKGITGSIKASVFGINNVLFSKVFNLNPAELFVTNSKSELFSVDYIFNLNDETAKEEYNQIIGQKYKMSSFKFAQVNPFASENRVKDLLYSDLETVQSLVDEDSQKPLAERRVIRLTMGENESKSQGMGVKIDLKLLQAQNTSRSTDSKVTLYSMTNNKKNYLLNTNSREMNAELFWVWGQKNRTDTGLLVEADQNFNPTSLIGLHNRTAKKELNLSRSEYENLKTKLNRTLPAEITSTLQWPAWPSDRSSVKDARIEQDIFFNSSSLETLRSVRFETIQGELRNIIRKWGQFSSRPTETTGITSDVAEPRIMAFNTRRFEEAYEFELQYIPQYLASVFNENETMANRMMAYEKLENLDLFKEIGSTLLIKLIPKDKLKDAISFRLFISANRLDGAQSYYPSLNHQQNMNVFLSVIANNAYIVDRSFNLGLYLNEKGQAYNLEEIVLRTK